MKTERTRKAKGPTGAKKSSAFVKAKRKAQRRIAKTLSDEIARGGGDGPRAAARYRKTQAVKRKHRIRSERVFRGNGTRFGGRRGGETRTAPGVLRAPKTTRLEG